MRDAPHADDQEVPLLRLATVVVAAAAATAAPSSPAGVALLGQVERTYAHVPGVIVTASTSSGPLGRFTEVLSGGTTVAEEFVSSGGTATTTVVARSGGPTYARAPGTKCWRALLATDPRQLTDIGQRFVNFDTRRQQIGAPRATAFGWTVAVSSGRVSATFAITRAHLVQSIAARNGASTAHAAVANLTRAPRIASPTPRCG